jgi:predicted permease
MAVAMTPSLLLLGVQRALLVPVPFDDPDRLVVLRREFMGGSLRAMTYPVFTVLEEAVTLDVAAYSRQHLILSGEGEDRVLTAEAVTPSFFRVLEVQPVLGRGFADDENNVPLGHPLCVLSHRTWQTRFGGRPDIVGRSAILNRTPFTVIGVMPEGFAGVFPNLNRYIYPAPVDAWIPLMMAPHGGTTHERSLEESLPAIALLEKVRGPWLGAVGRIRNGYDPAHVRAELRVLSARVEHRWPTPVDEGEYREQFWMTRFAEYALDPRILTGFRYLQAAALSVLTLASLGLGNMFLARSIALRESLVPRLVLGAPRVILVLGVLGEALLVALAGGAGGLLLSAGALEGLRRLEPAARDALAGMALAEDHLRAHWLLPLAAMVLACLAALVFGLLPALRATRVDLSASLRRSSTLSTHGGFRGMGLSRLRGVLTVGQLGLAVAVLVPGLLLIASFHELSARPPGFAPRDVVTVAASLPASQPRETWSALTAELIARIDELPGLNQVGLMSCLPVSQECPGGEARASESDLRFTANWNVVGPNTFRALGVSLRHGRELDARDGSGSRRVAVVSESAAALLGHDVLGRRVTIGTVAPEPVEVVGVVGDVPYEDLLAAPKPMIYIPYAQAGTPIGRYHVVARPGAGLDVREPVREVIASFQRGLGDPRVVTMRERLALSTSRLRSAAILLALASALAVVIAGTSMYGVCATIVGQALPEIGVRMALGATPGRIAGLVFATASRIALGGLLVGLGTCLITVDRARAYVHESHWPAALTVATGAAVMLSSALALAAAFAPARTAAATDPSVVLRDL